MTLFQEETNAAVSAEEAAALLLDAVPPVMRAIRAEMRSHRAPDLSVPQFRTLLFVNRNAGTSLSGVAEHLGLTLPSTSKLVDKLVARGLVAREDATDDRRRIALRLTEDGRSVLAAAAQATLATLAARLAPLSPDERRALAETMRLLKAVFGERNVEF
jgi:MarR family transcriptional regulator for hemolysin